MKNILIIGAGRSSSSLIEYILRESLVFDWHIVIADSNISLAQTKSNNHPNAQALGLDIFNEEKLEGAVANSHLVISMLPARFHTIVGHACLKHKKDLLTASYISEEMRDMDKAAKEAGVVFLNECGLDPGLDHMSAVKAISAIKEAGGNVLSFKSFTGGLIAPESDDNPWQYKFTWNPRNVVLAGQGSAAKFIRNTHYKYIPYHKLFTRFEPIHIKGFGDFEGYPNRDSLSYRRLYKIDGIPTMLRGTLRKPGFCTAWNAFVQLGMTDDSYQMEGTETMTYREYTNSFLGYSEKETVENKFCQYLNIAKNSALFNKFEWLELFSKKSVGILNATPAAVLQKILEEKWSLNHDDKDMVVMQHLLTYKLNGELREMTSSIVAKGSDIIHTAMSKTVGWPMAIAAKLILQDKIPEKGVLLPILPHIYTPILEELESMGIKFIEEETTRI